LQKINQANSWNFALIDYFHDMSLLRNNVDNSINFQRASSTLDGCVKIWTSRVDSVGTETGKLLSNLASDGREAEDEEPTSDNPDAHEPSQKKRKATHRSESTLAKNAAQLKSKKLDLEFSVDPLFRKTCGDFDEGGAHGLLMNHLGLGVGSEGALRVIFDASDPMGKVGEEEDLLEPEDDIDLTSLRRKGVSFFIRALLTLLAQMTFFQTWKSWIERPFPTRWKVSRFLGTPGLLTKPHFIAMILRLSRMTGAMRLITSILVT
jgi:condensin complex subunit 2